MPRRQQVRVRVFGPCYPHRRPGLSSWLSSLASPPAPAVEGIWVMKDWMGHFPQCLNIVKWEKGSLRRALRTLGIRHLAQCMANSKNSVDGSHYRDDLYWFIHLPPAPLWIILLPSLPAFWPEASCQRCSPRAPLWQASGWIRHQEAPWTFWVGVYFLSNPDWYPNPKIICW